MSSTWRDGLLAGLMASRVAPGDVVTFQTPNWLEGAITFYAASLLGAVVAPIVHIYGSRETAYILTSCRPTVHVTATKFGDQDFLANLEEVPDIPGCSSLCSTRRSGRASCSAIFWQPAAGGADRVDPGFPALVGWTSGRRRAPRA